MLLYIHIPFCDSKCHYCAFNSYTDRFHLKKEYMRALEKQLKNDLKNIDKKIETLFIGGGTPSTIRYEEYTEIFKIIKPYITDDCEITSECNPNSASKTWLEGMKSLGVNRISFGVQSFNDEKLNKLNRAHNAKGALSAIQNAICIGFNSINCDIIYGVQNDSFELIKEDFDTLFKLKIEHISAYSLTLEEGTKFYNKSEIKIDDEELSYKLFDYLKENGFTQYEISNFARKKDYESKHNYGYWQHKNYLGIGAGAVGCLNNYRYYPKKGIEEYIKNPLDYEIEELSNEDIVVEKVLLGLRCSNGFEKNILNEKQLKRLIELLEEDKVEEISGQIFNKNFLLADELALYILE
ncbi:coproporphyrinogen III oxidase [Halarcobacter ebronensis]|uniref:Heme chaperone HemW n=1 Tax=Halarcobacter ebronensis TaxID=1462615 RepID=A0A4Q0YHS9_9BACT|nr:radical SAM family heme chaperone HemW [Halarcobacter ebronensis]RXJ70226.1 coproporphyrinogen III oxidase [Halarcobacter ebronensis]